MSNNKTDTSSKYELVNFCEFDKYATKSYCAVHGVDESLNLGDITKVDETKIKPFNMICGGSPCFVKGTLVFTERGYVPIEEVKVNDKVLTHKNRYRRVIKTMVNNANALVGFSVRYGDMIYCTPEHPIYVRKCKDGKLSEPTWVKACDLSFGDNVCMAISPDKESPMLQVFVDEYFAEEGTVKGGQYVTCSYNRKWLYNLGACLTQIYKLPFFVKHLTEDLYKLELQMLPAHTQNPFYEDGQIWQTITDVTTKEFKGDVYNLEVEEDNTYMVENVVVHNCQDFSVAGKQAGSTWRCADCGHEYNPLTVHFSKRQQCPKCGSSNLDKTRSSLLVEWLRIIQANKPKWGIYENVKNIVGKQFKETFQMFLDELHEYGYNTYYKVLNAKDYGIPQNRERVYLIIIFKEFDNGKFKFPEPFDNGIRLKDMLEDEVDEKYYINTPKAKKLVDDLIASGKIDSKEISNAIRGGGEEV